METVIGLGKTGCSVADEFAAYEQYQIYKIDTGLDGFQEDGVYNFPKQPGPEEYERNCPDLKNFFDDCSGDILFIVDGSEEISAASLAILENLKDKDAHVNVLYVKQDIQFLIRKKNVIC